MGGETDRQTHRDRDTETDIESLCTQWLVVYALLTQPDMTIASCGSVIRLEFLKHSVGAQFTLVLDCLNFL